MLLTSGSPLSTVGQRLRLPSAPTVGQRLRLAVGNVSDLLLRYVAQVRRQQSGVLVELADLGWYCC